MIGSILSVERESAGVELASPASAGATTLTVVSALDLPESGGATLALPDGSEVVTGAVDYDAATVALASPLPAPVAAGDWLGVPGAVEVVATVAVGDDVLEFVTVPHALVPMLPDGVRSGDGEIVEVGVDDSGRAAITGVVGKEPLEVWGDPNGARVELSDDGIRMFRLAPNGTPRKTVSMTTTETSLEVVDFRDGSIVASVSEEGNTLTQDIDIMGTMRVGGQTLAQVLDRLPRGRVDRRFSGTVGTPKAVGEEVVSVSLRPWLEPGRVYRVSAIVVADSMPPGGVAQLRLRQGPGNRLVTTSDAQVGVTRETTPSYSSSVQCSGQVSGDIEVPSPQQVTIAVTYRGINGGTPRRRQVEIVVDDVGPGVAPTIGDEGGVPSSAVRTTWEATATAVYDRAGVRLTDREGQIQTWHWLGTPQSHLASAVLFAGGAVESTDPGEVGKSIGVATSGRAVWRDEIYIANGLYWSHSGGGTGLSFLAGNALPSTLLVDSTMWSEGIAEGAGRWISLPAGTLPATGTGLIMTVGDRDGSIAGGTRPQPSGDWHSLDSEHRPRIRRTYT